MEIRDYVIGQIKETYKTFGFSSMETPCVEHIENLSSNQGGENEKLIFKILKRGDKLSSAVSKIADSGSNSNVALSSDEDSLTGIDTSVLTDSGLRYDLTLPLSRYYANNANELPSPFKALQMGNVWRADRPQRGRYRQFMQCDIDILGEPTILAEIELITATTTLLGKIGFDNFTIRLNNRKMLKAMAAYSGFEEKDYDSVFITLDKMDKIGLEGVNEELVAQGYSKESVDKYLELFDKVTPDIAGVNFLKDTLGDFLEDGVAEDLETIMTSVDAVKSADFKIVFDPTLVRGMSYYTGPIFEISMDEYGGSVGGGGRYDEMIGKFTGQNTPACGFSSGFERIVMLLLEREYQVPTGGDKVAFLVEKNMPTEKMLEVLKEAKKQRENGTQVNIAIMKKNKKFQKEQLEKEGYKNFKEFFVDKM